MKIIKIASLSLVFALTACGNNYKEIEAKEFTNKLGQQTSESADLWLYYGTDDSYYYFGNNNSSGREFYRIKVSEIEVAHDFNFNDRRQVIIRDWHIKLRKG